MHCSFPIVHAKHLFPFHRQQRETPILTGIGPDTEAAGSFPMALIQSVIYSIHTVGGLHCIQF